MQRPRRGGAFRRCRASLRRRSAAARRARRAAGEALRTRCAASPPPAAARCVRSSPPAPTPSPSRGRRRPTTAASACRPSRPTRSRSARRSRSPTSRTPAPSRASPPPRRRRLRGLLDSASTATARRISVRAHRSHRQAAVRRHPRRRRARRARARRAPPPTTATRSPGGTGAARRTRSPSASSTRRPRRRQAAAAARARRRRSDRRSRRGAALGRRVGDACSRGTRRVGRRRARHRRRAGRDRLDGRTDLGAGETPRSAPARRLASAPPRPPIWLGAARRRSRRVRLADGHLPAAGARGPRSDRALLPARHRSVRLDARRRAGLRRPRRRQLADATRSPSSRAASSASRSPSSAGASASPGRRKQDDDTGVSFAVAQLPRSRRSRASSAVKSSGSADDSCTRCRHRMHEAERRGVQQQPRRRDQLAAALRSRGCRPSRRRADGRPRPGGCGSGASCRSRAAPRTASRRAAPRRTRTCVTARLPCSGARVEPRRPSPRSVDQHDSMPPIVDRARARRTGTCARRRARETAPPARARPAWSWRTRAGPRSPCRCGARRAAASSSPACPAAATRRGSESIAVPRLALLVRHARDARRLVDHHHVRVLEHDASPPLGLRRAARARRRRPPAPRVTRAAGSSAASPSTLTLPRVAQAARARPRQSRAPSRCRTSAASVMPVLVRVDAPRCFTRVQYPEPSLRRDIDDDIRRRVRCSLVVAALAGCGDAQGRQPPVRLLQRRLAVRRQPLLPGRLGPALLRRALRLVPDGLLLPAARRHRRHRRA